MKNLLSNVPNIYFSLFTEKGKDVDLHYTMKENNVGGPSIMFNRYHVKDKTFLRNVEMTRKDLQTKLCKKVVEYDATHSTSGRLCKIRQRVNLHDDWRATTFKSSEVVKWLEWLNWQAYQQQIKIRNENNNTEKRTGARRLQVDGFCPAHEQCFNFKVRFVKDFRSIGVN